MIRSIAILFMALSTSAAIAHHGTAGQFDHSASLEVSGVVTKLRFVNPHSYVYFDVTNEDGTVDNWRCEMRAATVLKRSGWSADMFPPGTAIHISGVPARREPHGCYVNELKLGEGPVIKRYEQLDEAEGAAYREEGRAAVLPNGQPNISGDWAARQRLLTSEQVKERVARGYTPTSYEVSAAGEAAAADFVLDRDNPRFHCLPVNIVDDWNFDQHINRIEQTDTTVVLTYGFMDIVRTIHLDMDEHPDDITPSRAGHSIGKWNGNVLEVDTIGFSEGYLDGRRGVMHSDQLRVTEQFELDPAEQSITRTYTVEDPLYLTASRTNSDTVYLSGTAFDPYDCDDLTEEVVEGF